MKLKKIPICLIADSMRVYHDYYRKRDLVSLLMQCEAFMIMTEIDKRLQQCYHSVRGSLAIMIEADKRQWPALGVTVN